MRVERTYGALFLLGFDWNFRLRKVQQQAIYIDTKGYQPSFTSKKASRESPVYFLCHIIETRSPVALQD